MIHLYNVLNEKIFDILKLSLNIPSQIVFQDKNHDSESLPQTYTSDQTKQVWIF